MRTLEWSVRLMLPPYVGPWESRVEIYKKLSPWFEINDIPVNPSTIRWVKESWARFLEIKQVWVTPVKVVEHMISALVAAGIDSAYISVDTSTSPKILWWKDGYMPVVWPWIQPIYEAVKDSGRCIVGWIEQFWVQSKLKLQFQDAKMIVEPSDTFTIEIQTHHRDLTDIRNKSLLIEDVIGQVWNHLTARPIARLQNYTTYWVFRVLNLFSSTRVNWITPETYIMWYPCDTWDDIVWRMQEQYQDWRNEHLHHTIYADFLGELHTFFPWVFKWKITLLDTDHITRIALLRMLLESAAIKKI